MLAAELSVAIDACFTLFSTAPSPLLSKADAAILCEVSAILQPLLLRLKKHAVQTSESSELFVEDEELHAAVVGLRRALEDLQGAAARSQQPHWLMRVLMASDVRLGLEQALQRTSSALGTLLEADGAADAGSLEEVQQLRLVLLQHTVTRHEPLEKLGAGLYKHMESVADAEQVVSMLRFVVREAQNLCLKRSRNGSASSRASDSSDKGASSSSSSGSGSGSGKADEPGSSANGGSSSSSSSSGGGKAKPGDVAAGDTSLSDIQLLIAVEQLADCSHGSEQLVLHQIASILEELHDAKQHRLKRKQQAANGHLSSVPEAVDDTIPALRRDQGSRPVGAPPAAAPNGHSAAFPAAAAAGAGGGSMSVGGAIAAMSQHLEELLWADPWDTAALTQLLELLMQAEAQATAVEEDEDEQYVEVDQDAAKASGKPKPGKKWLGKVGAAAAKALQSARAPAGKPGGKAAAAAARVASEQAAERRALQRERLHQLVVATLEVLLHLTPIAGESCFRALTRQDVTAQRSLAAPLMAHADTVPAICACLWSGWPDVALKAARLLATLLRSEAAVSGSSGVFAGFTASVCSSGGANGGILTGLAHLLHSSHYGAAGGAAEAVAALASLPGDACSGGLQLVRPLLMLVAKFRSHPAAGGAACTALQELGSSAARPDVAVLLANSYDEELAGAEGPGATLGDLLVAMMLSNDVLAACRAARLAASLACSVRWASTISRSAAAAGGSMWLETFRAGQHLLQQQQQRTGGSDGGTPSVCGARLLAQLVAHQGPSGKKRADDALLFEATQLSVHQLQLCDCGRKADAGQALALVQLISSLLDASDDVTVALPDLFGSLLPLLESMNGTGCASSALQHASQELHQQLMVLGG